MAARKQQKHDKGPALVDLTHPDGERHYEASTPQELHNLVSGHGYTITEGVPLEVAAEYLAANVSGSVGEGAAPAVGTTPQTTAPSGSTS